MKPGGISKQTISEEWWPSQDIDELRSVYNQDGTRALENADLNSYQKMKNIAEGMMDVALLSANTNQLRFIAEKTSHPYYYFSMTFIVFSIILQVLVAIGLLLHSRYKVSDEKHLILANRTNNVIILGVFLITIVNVFVCTFSTGSDVKELRINTELLDEY